MLNTLTFQPDSATLSQIKYLPSPFCDARPPNTSIDMVVIHGISLPRGEFGSDAIQQFFCGELDYSHHPSFAQIQTLKVSAHLFIKRTGEILQFVPFDKRAWHAGESEFAGRKNCNDFSIGIELEGCDFIPYDVNQYVQLAKTIKLLMQIYKDISLDRIVGHVDIAPGRKTDPGPLFDWDYLKGQLR